MDFGYILITMYAVSWFFSDGQFAYAFDVTSKLTTAKLIDTHATDIVERNISVFTNQISCMRECIHKNACCKLFGHNLISGECAFFLGYGADHEDLLRHNGWIFYRTRERHEEEMTVCPSSYTQVGRECFKLVDTALTKNRNKAKEYCQLAGGDLAEPDNLENLATLIEIIRTISPGITFWMGGSDAETEGTWVWTSTNTLIDMNHYWDEREPNKGTDENCIAITVNGMHDASCLQKFSFICERQPFAHKIMSF